MISQPSISILTPVWNGLPFIKECVESVLKQNYHDFEMLISDNVSTDGTRAYLETINDPRIKVFKQQRNLGIMNNVNFLFKQARAPISQILCADDYFIDASSLSNVVKYWSNASTAIGFVRFGHTTRSNKKIMRLQASIVPEVIESEQAELCFFVFGNIAGNLSEVSVRTLLVNEHNYFRPHMTFAGDFDFWSRLAKNVTVGIQKELVIYVRRHENVASNYGGLKGECYEQQVEIYERLIDNLSHTYSRKELIQYFHYEIFSYHYRIAMRSVLNGKFTYMTTLLKTNAIFLWPPWKRLLFTLPFVLFNRNQRLTYQMARSFIKTKETIHHLN